MTTVDDTRPAQAPQSQDWWDRLYAEAEDTFADPVALPQPRVGARTRDRLPRWWERKNADVLNPDSEGSEVEEEKDVDEEGQEQAEEPQPGEEETGTKPSETEEGPVPAPERQVFYPQPQYWPEVTKTVPKPALSAGTRRLLYNVSAGAAGWFLGLTPQISVAIETCGVATSIGGALVLGGGICLATAAFWDRRTRHWYQPLAWAARIPLMSAITALALYAPASQF
ncbi:hypothetical protein ACFXPY_45095 [Streptomyces sp. NPDC059153]|uniref:hypothetical protein n=1 Tax=Streptomyces sp. NPDC059153 TaxID=3346743 RepID=UPI0036C8CEF3